MIEELKSFVKEKLDLGNFFLGILFILLFSSTSFILMNPTFSVYDRLIKNIKISQETTPTEKGTDNQTTPTEKGTDNQTSQIKKEAIKKDSETSIEIIRKKIQAISMFETIIIFFLINILGYLVAFTLNAVYDVTHFIIGLPKVIFRLKPINGIINAIIKWSWVKSLIDFVSYGNTYEPLLNQILTKAEKKFPELTKKVKYEDNKKYLSQLVLSLYLENKELKLYKLFQSRISKIKLYQNVMSLIFFFGMFTLSITMSDYFISNKISILISFTVFITLFSTYLAYKLYEERIYMETLTFLEVEDFISKN